MNRKRLQGFTLIEMMISIAVASLLSIAVIKTFISQSSMYTIQSQRNSMANDGREAYEVISRLLRQAQTSSIATATVGTLFTIDFTVPSGFKVWPNITAPFTNNAVRLQWDSAGANANEIRITNFDVATGTRTLVGNTVGRNTQITNLNFTQNLTGDFALTLTARAGTNGPSSSFQGVVMPRN